MHKVEDNRIPVTIITGFLGAGKTTLLNQIINNFPLKKFAIIENEFGNIGIDGKLIDQESGVYELSNGCICCTLNNELTDTLYNLLDSKNNFNHLIIETTGVADPSAIVMSFLNDFGIQTQFKIDAIIALVDSSLIESQLADTTEANKQISIADVVLLNKIDLISTEKEKEIAQLIKSINPLAKQFSSQFASISNFENILSLNAYHQKGVLSIPTSPSNNTKFKHTSGLNSISLNFEGKINPILFDNWITKILYSMSIYRIKAIINMAMYDQKFIFQSVGTQFVSELGPAWEEGKRVNQIVFIGKNLEENILKSGLETCLEKLI